ncbi:MAG TPA: YtxH domain-containing protein [Gemmatimonadales bacterium]|nr:YtxH domain-containing protein [Gemmatimonadales bacterium]
MTDDTAERGSSLPWFLLGLGLGAGLGILFAPRSGEETRASVRKRLQSLRDVAGEQFEEAREAVVDRLDRVADVVAGEDEDDEEAPSRSTAREALQRRLHAARSRRRPAAAPGGDPEDEGPTT